MRTSSAGLLLLLIAVLGLVGFLTGNLDRWLAFMFDPSKPALSGAGSSSSGSSSRTAPATAQPALVSVAATTTRRTA